MKSTESTASFSVNYAFPLVFTADAWSPTNPSVAELLAKSNIKGRALVLLDRGASQARPNLAARIDQYLATHTPLQTVCDPITLPGGETLKNDHTYLTQILSLIERYNLCRHSYILALGGGALLDVAGYAAAIAHRGIRLIRFPSTVLSQGDAGVGVKNGLNMFGKKNFIGTFAPPIAVINDVHLLTSLEHRDWIAGISEAVKVALIKEREFFDEIEESCDLLLQRDLNAMERILSRSARIHLSHISQGGDPFESGTSRPLDFGHWAAHKLESLSDFRLRHGEAVAVGIALDSTYSFLSGMLSAKDWENILELLSKFGFALHAPELQFDALLEGLEEFREHLGGKLSITLLTGIGKSVQVSELDGGRMRESVELLRQFHPAQSSGRTITALAS